MPNYGRCIDCEDHDRLGEVVLNENGTCSICQSASTMKPGAIAELSLRDSRDPDGTKCPCREFNADCYCICHNVLKDHQTLLDISRALTHFMGKKV